jgi:hypothetical protein
MSNPLFYAPNSATAKPRHPQPGERLFEFLPGHERVLCELPDHCHYGVDAQFWVNEEFRYLRASTCGHSRCSGRRRTGSDRKSYRMISSAAGHPAT